MIPASDGTATTPTTGNGPIADTNARAGDAMPAPRRPWFRRKLIMIPLVFMVIVGAVGGYAGWKIYDSFSTINQISTPPPVVSGTSLGGDSSVSVDTAPAQAAVQTYEANQNQAASADPTQPANDIASAITPTPTQTPIEPTPEPDVALVSTSEPDEVNQPTDIALLEPTATSGSNQSESPAPTTEANDLPVIPQITTEPLPEFGEDELNILLMGVDANDGGAIDVDVRPDALAVLHLDRSDGSCRMLQIPRDTRVELPGYGLSKINHALAVGGIPYQTQVVEQYLGIELDHFGLIDFGGVIKIVDEVGGVEVDNPVAFTSLGFDFPVGIQTLDGDQALAYARFRGDEEGDFGRISRQQEVLRALLRKVSPGDLVGMITQMLPLLVDHLKTDLSPIDLADLARTYGSSCTYETLETSTLQGTTGTFFDPLVQLELSYVIIDPDELAEKKEWLLGDDNP